MGFFFNSSSSDRGSGSGSGSGSSLTDDAGKLKAPAQKVKRSLSKALPGKDKDKDAASSSRSPSRSPSRPGSAATSNSATTPEDLSAAASDAEDNSFQSKAEQDAAWLMDRKYILRVTAGSSYDTSTHVPVHVNVAEPLEVESEWMNLRLQVRIKDYIGLPRGSPTSTPYFDSPQHKSDRYSIGFSFVPKQTLPAKDLIWGNDFDHPIRDRLPPGFNTAFRIVKTFIDPGLSCDAYADEPWLYGPALSTWFLFRVGHTPAPAGSEDADTAAEVEDVPESGDAGAIVLEGADGNGKEVRDRLGVPKAADKRRKFFLSPENRAKFEFEKGRQYDVDFFNPYLDFNKFALRLPGFSLSVIKYIDDKTHNLRYVFKNERTGDVYLVVVFTLLFGKELAEAVAAETTLEQQPHKPRSGSGSGSVVKETDDHVHQSDDSID